jgi:adenine-specific DNA methylase
MSRPRVLIEQWLPIAEIGAECMRERGASSALPPLYFLHVWWARRPLTVSRAAVLASLLPAYPAESPSPRLRGEGRGEGSSRHDIRPWPNKFLKLFPTFDAYKAWFLKLIGIHGDPVAARRLIEWEKRTGKATPGNKYGYPRAFTYNPTDDQLETLYNLLEWTWGTREITFCDPMAGGGSIPFEALRYGLTVHANELNPIASIILKATLDYPARFGLSLVEDIRKYGKIWCERVRDRLKPFYSPHPPTPDGSLKGGIYLWARTVACPATGKPVPLSPNWWLRKGNDPMAVRLIADPKADRGRFEIVRGRTACERAKPDNGTIKRGSAVSPWTGDPIDGDYIKAEAQAGRMGQQLYAVEVYKGYSDYRAPTAKDEAAYQRAVEELERRRPAWEAAGLIPSEDISDGSKTCEPKRYGMVRWHELFSPRQLLAHLVILEELDQLSQEIRKNLAPQRAEAVTTYLGLAADKCVDWSSRLTTWHPNRSVVGHTFQRHDFSLKWATAEFDASRNLLPWALDQVVDAYLGIAKLVYPVMETLWGKVQAPIERLRITRLNAQSLSHLPQGAIKVICVDPPYYDNVQYAELSDFFYVWMKRSLGDVHPELLGTFELVPKDEEAVANPARFAFSKNKKELARQDYENKMQACFKEMHRVLADDGVLTVMFTHKQVEAWDTLGTALIRAGFRIDASWPVHTESEHSLHQAKKNAAASTILLVCRKRQKTSKPVWWDDLKTKVRERAREKAREFEQAGIRGVDLYISTFGPALSIISENWPVLTSQTDPKTGDPLPLKPGEALDLARQEVINLRKRGLLLGRSMEFDPITDWYLMAWDTFKAEEFPADEARKLALALGLDLERDIVRDKRLVTKKSASVVMNLPTARRKRDMVDPDAETFPHLIDALHTAMMIYDEEGSKACQRFVNRQGLRTDSRVKALVQAMMEAIPTTRDKDGKFLRPEMATLDALRLLFWEDLPAPKEEEPPKADQVRLLFPFEDDEEEMEEDEAEEAEE